MQRRERCAAFSACEFDGKSEDGLSSKEMELAAPFVYKEVIEL